MSKDVDKLIAEAESLKIQELKADNLKLLKQLDRAKNKKADLIEAMYDAVRMNVSTWAKPNVPKPTLSKANKNEEVTESNSRIYKDNYNDPDYQDGIELKEILEEVGDSDSLTIKKASGGIARMLGE